MSCHIITRMRNFAEPTPPSWKISGAATQRSIKSNDQDRNRGSYYNSDWAFVQTCRNLFKTTIKYKLILPGPSGMRHRPGIKITWRSPVESICQSRRPGQAVNIVATATVVCQLSTAKQNNDRISLLYSSLNWFLQWASGYACGVRLNRVVLVLRIIN